MLHWSDLRSYQVARVWTLLSRKRHALLLGLGTGKTIITLTSIACLRALGLTNRVLIVAPKSVAQTVWHIEAANWSHTKGLDFALCLGSESERKEALGRLATVTAINVENLLWLCDYYPIKDWPFDTVVLDESSLFKNNTSLRFKRLRKYTRTERTKRRGGLVRVKSPISRLVLLTATPCSNGLKNLWSQSVLMDNGRALMRSFTAFTSCYFDTSKYNRKLIPREGSSERIYKKIAPLVSVLRAEDVIDMEPTLYNTIEVDLPDEAWSYYRELQKEALLALEDGSIVKATTKATLRAKLHQFCNGASYIGDPLEPDYKKEWRTIHDAKLDKLEELVESSGEPLIIGYWFEHDKVRIMERLGKRATLFDKKNTLKTVQQWNAGEIDNLVGQIGSMSHGLNLQHGGCSIVFFSLLDDLEVHDQFVGRLARSGQKNMVTVTYITCKGTVEGNIARSLYDKSRVQYDFLEALAIDPSET